MTLAAVIGLKRESESFKGHKIAWIECKVHAEAMRAMKRPFFFTESARVIL